MVEPGRSEHVICHKAASVGRVTVHGWRLERLREDTIEVLTDCGRTPAWDRSWFWVEYQTLNPSKAIPCKRCWIGEQVDQ